MDKTLYLVNPRSALPGYFGTEVFAATGLAPTVGIADLATPTVAALAPRDWAVTVCEEHLNPADFDTTARFVGLTGKITQVQRLIELAAEFRRRGKTVIAGGPFASLDPEALRGRVDILVRGEFEAIATKLFNDLESGTWHAEYTGERADLSESPLPRWDLYPNSRALAGCVQTSRGCPFQCEFCDVIAYLGRHQRHKPVERVLAELDNLYGLGYRSIFLADDNFTVYRRRTRELLDALRAWNQERRDGPVLFGTQVSMDAARDPGLVAQCATAGIEWVFIGLETPSAASLKECRKPQNLAVDPRYGVDVFLSHGIAVSGGMIVGFDHDGPDIFARQYEFAMSLPIPVFSVGALVAPVATALHARLAAADRLRESAPEVAALPWDTNIVPALLSRDELVAGLRRLCNALYAPSSYAQRLQLMVQHLAPHPLAGPRTHLAREADTDALFVAKSAGHLGGAEATMVRSALRAVAAKPHAARATMTALIRYAQIRYMYEREKFWDAPQQEVSFSLAGAP